MQKLMVRIGLPVRWLAPSCNNDTGAIFWHTGRHFYRCGEVHVQRDRTYDALRVINEANQLA